MVVMESVRAEEIEEVRKDDQRLQLFAWHEV